MKPEGWATASRSCPLKPSSLSVERNPFASTVERPGKTAASDLIAALQTEPIPEGAQPREPGSRVYRYAGAGYQVIFEIDDLERIIRVLGIRQTGEGEE